MDHTVLTVDETSNGRQVELPVGQLLEIYLPENRTTGFKWNVESSGEPACTLVRSTYNPGRSIGQGGEHRWQFQARQAGAADIELLYCRSWERKKAARKFTLHLRVYE